DGFLGACSQVLDGAPRDQNSWEFWYVAAIARIVPFDDQRVRSDHLISLLDTSLPQNGAIGARSNVVAEFPRHNGNAALGVLEHPMVARCPGVAPARSFQCPDQIANLDCHEFMARFAGAPPQCEPRPV